MRCVEMRYEAAASMATPSYSRKSPKHISRLKKEGGKVYSPGNGWAYVYQTSKLLLVLADDQEIDAAPFFKERWGKLTAGRRETIEETMPASAKIVEGEALDNAVLEEWFLRAQKADIPAARKARNAKKAAKEAAEARAAARELARYEKQRKKGQEEKIATAPKFAFEKGYNNKRQREQWRSRTAEGVLYVLCDEDSYCPEEGVVPVEVMRELVPGKILLVRRLVIY